MRHEDSVLALAVAAAAVPAAVALPILWAGDFDAKTQWTLTLFIVVGVAVVAAAVHARVTRPLQTLGNLIAALRERDYAVRGRHGRHDDALGLAITELAALAGELREERHRDEEAAAGLGKIVEGLDVAVIAVDRAGEVRLANPPAERLLTEMAIGSPDEERRPSLYGGPSRGTLRSVADLLAGDSPRTVRLVGAPWEVRRSEVRLSGVPHTLIVLTDVQRALRAEEREAWRRLVRVLGHEINNSLGPIGSIAETLRAAVARQPRPADLDEDLERGLAVIERRSAALARFMSAYARLARLPAPRAGRVDVAAWVRRTAALETRLPVEVRGGPDLEVDGDADQLDQLLINLVANAVEATQETGGGGVRVDWRIDGDVVEVVVEDDGPGLSGTANLFVPFFTTKQGGSGIGLALARQIAEAHGGSVELRDRDGARGCQAVVRLPR